MLKESIQKNAKKKIVGVENSESHKYIQDEWLLNKSRLSDSELRAPTRKGGRVLTLFWWLKGFHAFSLELQGLLPTGLSVEASLFFFSPSDL